MNTMPTLATVAIALVLGVVIVFGMALSSTGTIRTINIFGTHIPVTRKFVLTALGVMAGMGLIFSQVAPLQGAVLIGAIALFHFLGFIIDALAGRFDSS